MGILQPHLKHGKDCALFLLPRNGKRAKKDRKMKAVKAVFKVIWWIVRIPILPLILAWRWSKGKGKGAGIKFGGGGKEETVSTPGLGRFMYFVFYSAILYAILYALVVALIIIYGLVVTQFTAKSNKEVAPVVEQAVETNNTGTVTNNVLLDK